MSQNLKSRAPRSHKSRVPQNPKPRAPRLHQVYYFLLEIMPLVLFFSFFPVIALGSSNSMNFELSLPLIWLVIFDFLSLIIFAKYKLFPLILKKWPWLLLPIFVTLSIAWSLNFLRGFLTAGILWLIYFAVFSIVIISRSIHFPPNFATKFWRIFFASSLIICAWCWLQCILDLAGLSKVHTLMCNGCTSSMFGFPHPSGFAIEPQFMGNLLLAPTLIAAWFSFDRKKYLVVFFALLATLFLTFSRGAIYAFIVAMFSLTVFKIIQEKSCRVLINWLLVVLAFLFTLNAQGIMTTFGPTNDTYKDGVAKALNHLSLGVIDVRDSSSSSNDSISAETSTKVSDSTSVFTIIPLPDKSGNEDAVFDGYVESSTTARVNLTDSALEIWSKNPLTALFGVGIGGAGEALYLNDLSPAPKEIVQNQYASLLLELGLAGTLLAIFTLILIFRRVFRSPFRAILASLILAYGVTLCFFSGLPNALHIYLLPPLFAVIFESSYGKSSFRKSRHHAADKIVAQPRGHFHM